MTFTMRLHHMFWLQAAESSVFVVDKFPVDTVARHSGSYFVWSRYLRGRFSFVDFVGLSGLLRDLTLQQESLWTA